MPFLAVALFAVAFLAVDLLAVAFVAVTFLAEDLLAITFLAIMAPPSAVARLITSFKDASGKGQFKGTLRDLRGDGDGRS